MVTERGSEIPPLPTPGPPPTSLKQWRTFCQEVSRTDFRSSSFPCAAETLLQSTRCETEPEKPSRESRFLAAPLQCPGPAECLRIPLIPGHPYLDAICMYLHIDLQYSTPLPPAPPSRGLLGENKTNVFTKPAEMCSSLTQRWDLDTPETRAQGCGKMAPARRGCSGKAGGGQVLEVS